MIATTLLLASNMSGLTGDSVAILKEPTGGYYVGFPFDIHAANYQILIKEIESLGYHVEEDLGDTLESMSSYSVVSCKIQGKEIRYFEPTYLYSKP